MDKRRLSNLSPNQLRSWVRYASLLFAVLAGIQGCSTSGQAAHGQRNLDAIRIDTEIDDQANRALVKLQPLSEQSHIIITTYNRVALLSGQTPKAQWRRRAAETVRAIPRVRHVYNELEVAPPASLPALSRDAFITSSVKSALLRSDDVAMNDVKVITESRVVYLMGLVTPTQASVAADLARRINGVNKVVLLFEEV